MDSSNLPVGSHNLADQPEASSSSKTEHRSEQHHESGNRTNGHSVTSNSSNPPVGPHDAWEALIRRIRELEARNELLESKVATLEEMVAARDEDIRELELSKETYRQESVRLLGTLVFANRVLRETSEVMYNSMVGYIRNT